MNILPCASVVKSVIPVKPLHRPPLRIFAGHARQLRLGVDGNRDILRKIAGRQIGAATFLATIGALRLAIAVNCGCIRRVLKRSTIEIDCQIESHQTPSFVGGKPACVTRGGNIAVGGPSVGVALGSGVTVGQGV